MAEHEKVKEEKDGFTGVVHGFLQRILDSLSKTLRSFVAFSMAMFFFGILFGHFVAPFASHIGIDPNLLRILPLFLSVLAYYFTEVAAVIFILMLGLFLLFFL